MNLKPQTVVFRKLVPLTLKELYIAHLQEFYNTLYEALITPLAETPYP